MKAENTIPNLSVHRAPAVENTLTESIKNQLAFANSPRL